MPSPSNGNPKRDWRLYAQDMDRFAHRAVSYCADLNRAQFEANQLMQDAVLRCTAVVSHDSRSSPSLGLGGLRGVSGARLGQKGLARP